MCERTKLLAGFGMTDITPFAPVHLGSYGNGMERLSTHVKEGDSFKAWCLALTDDDGETVVMVIKKMTPHEMTLLMGYSCGVHCYCPDKEAAEHLGYEAYPRGIPGTAELIRDTHLSALRAMHDQA